MKTLRKQRNQLNQINKSVFLFHRYRIQQHGTKKFGYPDEAREIGKAMAHKVAKKLQLKLDV